MSTVGVCEKLIIAVVVATIAFALLVIFLYRFRDEERGHTMKGSVPRGTTAVAAAILLLATLVGHAMADDLTVYCSRDFSSRWIKAGQWALFLRFNHPVFPSNVNQSLTITADGAKKPYRLVNRDGQELTGPPVREMYVASSTDVGRPETIRLILEKGLTDATGRRSLAKDFSFQFRSVDEIVVTGVSTYFRSAKDKGIKVNLSGSISERDFARSAEIRPSVPNLAFFRDSGRTQRISGDFEFNKEYVLEIKGGPVDSGNAVLAEKTYAFRGPGLKQEATPRSNRSVVELFGRQLFPVTLSNLTKVRCDLRRVPPFLVPEAAQAVKDGRGIDWEKRCTDLRNLADQGKIDPVFAGQATADADVFFAPEAKDHVYGFSLPLSFRTSPKDGGAFVMRLSAPDGDFNLQIPRLIQVTDLSVSYKLSDSSLLVWVTSIRSGNPVAGAKLLLSTPDGTRFFVGKTNQDGLLLVQDGRVYPAVASQADSSLFKGDSPLSLASATWLVATTGSDSCGIDLGSLRFQPYGIVQARRAKDRPDAVKGAVFTERGIYRPGETVHFKYVARAYEKNSIVPPSGTQVKVEVVGPTQDIPYSKELTLGEFGTCHDSFATEKFFPQGTYEIKVHSPGPGDTKEVFSSSFLVQDYKRARHYARLTLNTGSRQGKGYVGLDVQEQFLDVEVSGQYYTGGPVKNGQVRWKASLVPIANQVPGLTGYFFGNDDTTTRFLESGESTLDGEGKLRFVLPLDSRLLTGIYGIEVSATVLDVDGEPATDVQTFKPDPQFLVGISRHPAQVQTGYEAPLKIVVVDRNGNKVSAGSVEVSLMELDSFYVQKRDETGNINYLWEEGWLKTLTASVSLVQGDGTFPVSLNRSGSYLISFIYVHEGRRFTSQTVFKVGWRSYEEWMRTRDEKEVQTGNQVFLTMSKKQYAVGEEVDVSFQAPRPMAKCLITLEGADVFRYQVIDAGSENVSYRFKVSDQYVPNVYISMIAAAGRGDFPVYTTQTDSDIPSVYYGYADISVSSTSQELRLEIAPEEAELKGRPGEKKTLSFKVQDGKGKGARAEMAVCVVDEAVLALTRFQTPNLEPLTRFNLPLAVFSGDLRLDLVSQDLFRVFSTRPVEGGGGALGEMFPSLRKDFRPVAYFNPAVHTNESGEATVSFTLPDTTTAYRVYAVVCDAGSAFASGERTLVVTKEFFVEPSPPRFLIPGDSATFPVLLHNKTKEKGRFSLSAEASRFVNIRTALTAGVLEPFSTLKTGATVEVFSGAESARLTFKGAFAGDTGKFSDAIELTCPVLSRFLPVRRADIGDFVQQKQIEAKLPSGLTTLDRGDLHPDDFKAILSVGVTNWSKLAPGLKYLLTYPYGCVEQTSSGVIPLAGIRSLVSAAAIPGITAAEVDKFLKGGVDRLLAMQTPEGGFSYWPGEQTPSWWGTMYATFALTQAKQAGHNVPEQRLQKALGYLRKNLFEHGEDRLHGAAWTRELAVYNLALHKELSAQELERFFERYDQLGDQSKALLLMSAHRIGYMSKQKLQEKLQKLNPQFDATRTSYYNSSVREIAACLLAAMDLGGAPRKAEQWAGQLIRTLRPEGAWYSTADTGWCILGLSRFYAKTDERKRQPVKITVDYAGHDPVEFVISEETAYVPLDPFKLLDRGSINLKCDTSRMVNYTLELTYPDVVTDPAVRSAGFSLQKKIENLNGKEEIRVGDIVRVILEIGLQDPNKAYTHRRFEYLALIDPVPAGLVPINPEIKSEGVEAEAPEGQPLFSGFSNFTPNHVEFRDDGVRVFKNQAWTGTYRYSYLARAVTEGDFWMRGARISLMYDPAYFGRTEGKRVQILPSK